MFGRKYILSHNILHVKATIMVFHASEHAFTISRNWCYLYLCFVKKAQRVLHSLTPSIGWGLDVQVNPSCCHLSFSDSVSSRVECSFSYCLFYFCSLSFLIFILWKQDVKYCEILLISPSTLTGFGRVIGKTIADSRTITSQFPSLFIIFLFPSFSPHEPTLLSDGNSRVPCPLSPSLPPSAFTGSSP